MARKRISKKHDKNNCKLNDRIKLTSNNASLCALAHVIKDKNILKPIHNNVNVKQRDYYTVLSISWCP